MYRPTLFVATVLTLASCALSPPLPRRGEPGYVRVYDNYYATPECPVRTVGSVGGMNHTALMQAAKRLGADAVILDPWQPPLGQHGMYTGAAIVFVEDDCRQ